MAKSGRTPYTTLGTLLTGLPGWLQGYLGDDVLAQRWRSCELYRDMYWLEPGVFRLQMRGADQNPIYVPSARTIVDTAHRFIAKDFNWQFAATSVGTDDEKAVVQTAMDTLFKRERFRSKFVAQKREGLIKGDFFWHIVGNTTAAPTRRISIYEVSAESVIWIPDPNDDTRTIGAHVIEPVTIDSKDYIRRQTYMKILGGDGVTLQGIQSSCGIFEQDKWQNEKAAPFKWVKNPFLLDPRITSIPLYQAQNRREGSWRYGVSELKGLETLISAMNQGITDEELALVLDGIGVYATTSGPPTDDEGNEEDWVVAGGRVVEHDVGTTFERITGVSSVDPYRSHEDAMRNWLYEGSGTPAVSRGIVDVSVVQSGVSLKLQAGPMLARVDEHNDLILDCHDQMYYDLLHMWFPVYEAETGIRPETQLVIEPQVGDALPTDNDQKLQNVLAMYEANAVDLKFVHDQLVRMGWDIGDMTVQSVLDNMKVKAEASDPVGTQLALAAGNAGAAAEGSDGTVDAGGFAG
jgi:hypothetical protein